MFKQFIPYLCILQIITDSAEEVFYIKLMKSFYSFTFLQIMKIDTKGTQRKKLPIKKSSLQQERINEASSMVIYYMQHKLRNLVPWTKELFMWKSYRYFFWKWVLLEYVLWLPWAKHCWVEENNSATSLCTQVTYNPPLVKSL